MRVNSTGAPLRPISSGFWRAAATRAPGRAQRHQDRARHRATPRRTLLNATGRRERRRGKDRYTKVSKTGIVEITPATIQRLRELGHDVYDASMMCNVQAVFRNPDTGELTAVSDRRATGEPRAR